MAPKDQQLALSSGMGLAGVAVTYFYEQSYAYSAFECFWDEIIESIIKPNKVTSLHYYLSFIQDIEREVELLYENTDDMESAFLIIRHIIEEVNLDPHLPEPDFDNCDNENGHWNCKCNEIIQKWVDYIRIQKRVIDELIIHSAFQFIFQDRNFLHNFHKELAEYVENNIDEIAKKYPECVTKKGRIKRKHFPTWLTSAIFYRDKGTCAICRCDLSNLIRTQNTIHIDHIIPLDLYGTNDASNFQLLCETCNTSKGSRSTVTSKINVPFWNL